jgi:hypothetical protein
VVQEVEMLGAPDQDLVSVVRRSTSASLLALSQLAFAASTSLQDSDLWRRTAGWGIFAVVRVRLLYAAEKAELAMPRTVCP